MAIRKPFATLRNKAFVTKEIASFVKTKIKGFQNKELTLCDLLRERVWMENPCCVNGLHFDVMFG